MKKRLLNRKTSERCKIFLCLINMQYSHKGGTIRLLHLYHGILCNKIKQEYRTIWPEEHVCYKTMVNKEGAVHC